MTEATELFKNFQHLWQAGKDARLNLECHAGQVWLHLQVQLHHPPSPQQYHPHPPRQGPSRLRRRARRAEERAKAAANAAPTPSKSTAEVFAQTDEIQTVDAAVQAAIPTPIAVDAAVQAVEETVDGAVQADPPPHQEGRPSQGVLVLAEQEGQPPRADLPLHHRLDDLMCRDTEYLPALLGQLSDREQYRVDREREREKDLQNFTKMLEDSFLK